MKYNPSLAYRAIEWHITFFTKSVERTELIAILGLVGAICEMFSRR